jgi:hypothetical protein
MERRNASIGNFIRSSPDKLGSRDVSTSAAPVKAKRRNGTGLALSTVPFRSGGGRVWAVGLWGAIKRASCEIFECWLKEVSATLQLGQLRPGR